MSKTKGFRDFNFFYFNTRAKSRGAFGTRGATEERDSLSETSCLLGTYHLRPSAAGNYIRSASLPLARLWATVCSETLDTLYSAHVVV